MPYPAKSRPTPWLRCLRWYILRECPTNLKAKPQESSDVVLEAMGRHTNPVQHASQSREQRTPVEFEMLPAPRGVGSGEAHHNLREHGMRVLPAGTSNKVHLVPAGHMFVRALKTVRLREAERSD